ncbi:MAG: SAM-dependent methyltransferase [Planctomycetota bacterium]
MADDYKRFDGLTYNDYKKLAKNGNLSCYEKIGYPDSYREGYESHIFEDVKHKLTALRGKGKVIMDIGAGCSGLPKMLIDLCEKNKHKLILIDSEEMLSHLPNKPFIEKYCCKFPDCGEMIEKYQNRVNAILAYGVLSVVFLDSNPFRFIDAAAALLSEDGEFLLGEIPNVTKRKRFFSSRKGIETHRKFTGTDEKPVVEFMKLDEDKIDDGVVFAILQRYRNAGFETYLLPQGKNLPMQTRREDILIVKR